MHHPNAPELILIMPVFNEQASVRKVVIEWFREIENWTENFIFLAIDDGSTDASLQVLERLRGQLGSRFEILTRDNRGHGPTCIQGYEIASQRNIPYVFQIDSDGQCDPQYFFRFWRERNNYDAIYGKRNKRDDGWRRVLGSIVLRLYLLIFQKVYCVDANVPYRLMRTEVIKQFIEPLSHGIFLANVALAICLRREGAKEHSIPIHFKERYGGEPSVTFGKFGSKALELHRQLAKI